jgi:hypothetical protein
MQDRTLALVERPWCWGACHALPADALVERYRGTVVIEHL